MQGMTITLPAGEAYESGDTARVELDGVVFDPAVDLAPDGEAFDEDIILTTPPLAHGLHTVDVTTIDAVGNETATASVDRFIDTGPTEVRDMAFAQEEPDGNWTFDITPPFEWEQ